jgi:hypothetical protein
MSRLRKCSHGYYGGWGCFDCQVPGLPTQSPLATNVRENGVSINNGQGETADSEQWLIENGYTSFDSETSRFVPNGHSFSDVLSAYGAALRERVRELEGACERLRQSRWPHLEREKFGNDYSKIVLDRQQWEEWKAVLSAQPITDSTTEQPQKTAGGDK